MIPSKNSPDSTTDSYLLNHLPNDGTECYDEESSHSQHTDHEMDDQIYEAVEPGKDASVLTQFMGLCEWFRVVVLSDF
ncbi:hypothetical protein CSKR_200715 [Clonorchis sinensis]|uniref:Uncharacterized protein n=1 Tax=Clonorchis sinensis TaxID=79923 RepID=A0A8T1MFU2_CLOSI|nr:hypothetical protein CSKR_200715 [Clonorchis sinensis]